MTDELDRLIIESGFNHLPKGDFPMKVSIPTKQNKDKSHLVDYNNSECFCSEKQKESHDNLVSVIQSINFLIYFVLELEKKNDDSEKLEKYKNKLKQSFEIYKKQMDEARELLKIEEQICQCWTRKEKQIIWIDIKDHDDEIGLPYYEYKDSKYYIHSKHTLLNYENGVKKIIPYESNYLVSPLGQQLKKCQHHGNLCNHDKEILHENMLHDGHFAIFDFIDPVEIQIVNGVEIAKKLEPPLPQYGLYVYFNDGQFSDLICYDNCHEKDTEYRCVEILLKDQKFNSVKFKENLPNKLELVRSKIKNLETYRKDYIKLKNDFKTMKAVSDNKEIEKLEQQISEIENRRNQEKILLLSLEKESSVPIKNETQKIMPTFEEILEMELSDESKYDTLNNLLVDYENSVDEQDELKIRKNIQLILEEYANVFEIKVKDDQSNIDLNIENQKNVIMDLNSKLKSLNRIKDNKEADIKSAKLKYQREQREIEDKQKILEKNSLIVYFECQKFIDDCNKHISEYNSSIYDEENTLIPEHPFLHENRFYEQKIQLKLKEHTKFVKDQVLIIKRKQPDILKFLETFSLHNNLEEKYNDWISEKNKYKISQTERILLKEQILKEKQKDDPSSIIYIDLNDDDDIINNISESPSPIMPTTQTLPNIENKDDNPTKFNKTGRLNFNKLRNIASKQSTFLSFEKMKLPSDQSNIPSVNSIPTNIEQNNIQSQPSSSKIFETPEPTREMTKLNKKSKK